MLTASQLTAAERWRIHRRRNAMTQVQMAKSLRVHVSVYRKAEEGDPDALKALGRQPGLGKIAIFEHYQILRRRQGLTLGSLAEQSGISKFHLCRIESGTVPVSKVLIDYWQQYA